MSRLTIYDCDPRQLSPLTLAFVGDGVFDLFIREEIVCSANRPVKELNKLKVERVRCEAQARLYEAMEQELTEEEADIFFEDRSGHILNDDLLSRLISMPNVIVTSHQAFLTEEALNNIAETTVGNILSCFEKDGICNNELCYRCGNIERCKKERNEKCF